jgi:nitrile hydratase accessory protein
LSGPERDALQPRGTDADERGFDEPWQAQVLGVAYSLAERGVFSRGEWSDALGSALRGAAEAGAPDTQATYYAAALQALEGLLARSGAVPPELLGERTEAWRRAYLATPHGEPVELSAGEGS